ncbi:MAG: epoxyqueuosine reductase QueH [Candidatus Omnitrophica bacterium]|nr:epoxyqueuosine reductase QueH [Candidatus Omnitrophota bacterium]
MKLLMHICCAPCAIYPINTLKGRVCDSITGFYFNPNIHPREEYDKRRLALEYYSMEIQTKVVYPEYNTQPYFDRIAGNEESDARCSHCWRMRLEATAGHAKEEGFDAFTTTLLISPYQQHDIIKRIAQEVSHETGVGFLYHDFREGFKKSQQVAREKGLYRQKYCGCDFSMSEKTKVRKV